MNTTGRFNRFFQWNSLSLFAVLLLILLALFLPPVMQQRPVFTLQMSFDISQSMNAEDMLLEGRTVSRLIFAKAATRHLLQHLPCGSRVGWSVFTGQRVVTLTMPLDVCKHYDALLAALDNLDGRMRWSNSSAVGKGLHQSLRAVKSAENGAAVIYISDGHEAPPLRQGQSGIPDTSRLAVDGIVVGVGGVTPVPIPKTDAHGGVSGYWQADEVVQLSESSSIKSREHLSYLHADHLSALARIAGLSYVGLDAPEVLTEAVLAAPFAEIRSTEVEVFHLPAALALFILCWRFLPWRLVYRSKSVAIGHS